MINLMVLFLLTMFISQANPEMASATLITFDDAPSAIGNYSPTIINSRYANLGVTFSCYLCSNGGGPDVYADYSGYSSSSPNNVSITHSNCCEPGVFDVHWGYIKASFSSLQREVAIDAITTFDGLSAGPLTGGPFMEAFDSSGNLLSLAEYPFSSPPACCIPYTLEIEQSIPDISYVLFSAGTFQNTTNGLVIIPGNAPASAFDNLYYSVPEPSTFILFGLGILGIFRFHRKVLFS